MDDNHTGEDLVFCHDRPTGLRAVIAVDDTRLGPAVGGVRMKAYPDELAAALEAKRLAAAMTLKNAAAGLPFGGGKSVIIAEQPPQGEERQRLLLAFGGFVAQLGGKYIPGIDMGTSMADLATIGVVAPRVACHDSDPSPWTALGVYAGIRAAVAHVDGRRDVSDLRVAIQGAGHVGATLAELLSRGGAQVVIADIHPARARAVAAKHGCQVVSPDEIIRTPCHVLAPCAVGQVFDTTTADRLRCGIIAGAANDQLADRDAAAALAAAGVLYVPDFLVNAGGVVQIHAAMQGWDHDRLHAEVLKVGPRVDSVLRAARTTGLLPLDMAKALAQQRLTARSAASEQFSPDL